jgi:hypothetical protein
MIGLGVDIVTPGHDNDRQPLASALTQHNTLRKYTRNRQQWKKEGRVV